MAHHAPGATKGSVVEEKERYGNSAPLLIGGRQFRNCNGDHDVRKALQPKTQQHQESSASSFDNPECQRCGDAVCGRIDAGQDAGHQLAHAEVVLEDDREVIVQSIDAAHLLFSSQYWTGHDNLRQPLTCMN